MIVALGGLKGGTGKTTLAAGLAAAAHATGLRVLLLDTTKGGDLAYWAHTAGNLPFPCAHLPAQSAADPAALRAFALGYELCIIDADPLLGAVQRAVSAVSDLVLVPVGASPMDVWSAGEAQVGWGRENCRIVCNGHDPRTRLGARLQEDLVRSGLLLTRASIVRRSSHAEAMAFGSAAPLDDARSAASLELAALLDESRAYAARQLEAATHVH